MSQKHLLIYWPTRNFLEVIKPLLPVLQNNYKIFAILSNCSHTSFLFENLLDLKHKNIIEKFYITPPNQELSIFQEHMKELIKSQRLKKIQTNNVLLVALFLD